MKIYYLSPIAFADTDITVVHHLAKGNDLIYGVLFPANNNNFSERQLKEYCIKHAINYQFFFLKYRQRNPFQLKVLYDVILSVKKAEPDIVYVNDYGDVYLNLLLLIFINKKLTIVGKHDIEIHSGMKSKFLLKIGINMLPLKFNNFLTFSETQEALLKKKLKNKNVFSIPFTTKDFGPRVNRNENDDTVRFLFFGNIIKYKGLDILLKAVDVLSKRHHNFRLEVAGRASDWDAIYAPLVENNAVVEKHIRFIDNNEIPAFFSRANYLILPYRDVTQSGPLMIAYNYNVPIIASKLKGFQEFIEDGITGFFFDREDENSLVKVLEEAITRSREDYDLLISNIIHYKERFSIENIIKRYNILFSDIYGIYHPVKRN